MVLKGVGSKCNGRSASTFEIKLTTSEGKRALGWSLFLCVWYINVCIKRSKLAFVHRANRLGDFCKEYLAASTKLVSVPALHETMLLK